MFTFTIRLLKTMKIFKKRKKKFLGQESNRHPQVAEYKTRGKIELFPKIGNVGAQTEVCRTFLVSRDAQNLKKRT